MRKKVMAGALLLTATALWASSASANPFWFGKSHKEVDRGAHVILAQAGSAEMRVQQLEEQLRQLNGRVEEMSFQLLQMQEQLRKAQEDNEFRFQELEGGGKPKKKSSLETEPGSATTDTANASGATSPEAEPQHSSDAQDTATLDQPMDGGFDDPALGKPPADLGSLELDDVGKVIGSEQNSDDGTAAKDLPPPTTDTTSETAAVASSGEEGQYQASYEQVLSGDYAAAEQGFADFIATHPDSKRIADANFWLGEAQYSQAKYTESAKTFLNAYKTYGQSPKAPEMLLKLAMSLAALDSKDTACATLRQVPKAYPKASRAVITKVASEQKRLAC